MTLTFRHLVAAFTTAVLVTSLAPAAPTRADEPVETQALELTATVDGSRDFPLSMPASHVAVHWPGAPDARLTVAFSTDGATFGADEPVEIDEVGAGRGDGRTYGALMLADGAHAVRVTSDRPLAGVELLVLDTRRDEAGAWGLGATAAATVVQPNVIPRAAWGADESLRFDPETGEEEWPREYFPVQRLVVHHTVMGEDDTDPAASVRAIYYYHAITQDWGDIGYNFLVDSAGRVYEGRYSREYAPDAVRAGDDGRGHGVMAAHARTYNAGTLGIALIGDFDDRVPTTAARDALVRMLTWASIRYGLNPHGYGTYVNPVTGLTIDSSTIAGHRDYNPTACPGLRLYSMLGDIRNRVASQMVAQTFSDVAGSPFIGDIAWLYSQTISNGCAPGRFCPGSTVSRQEMASFLARALRLPPGTRDYFWDDNGSPHEADINAVAEAKISLGCALDGLTYCPGGAVTRGEMASFLARGLKLAPAPTDRFTDDEDSLHEDAINRVAQAGITVGCDGSLYCPNSPTMRDQMAAFLRRGLTR